MKLKTLLMAGVAALAALPALARENHGLLIGASTYPALEERFWLKGPANDIDLVQTYLLGNEVIPFEAEDVTVLADGIEGKEAPTLAAIRTAFRELAERVEPGDFVYLHFSGHGSQAPARDPDSELDGLDELFLPVDIGPWNDSVGEVENALVDDEIGELIGMLREKGADVWVVFDSCHSGTATRAAPTGEDDEKMRKLEPGALGVPQETLADAQGTSRGLEADADPRDRADAPVAESEERAEGEGSFVAFFAAQTNETTPEKLMPRSTKDRLQGVFTYTIFETLAERPGITYRQLGQEILRKYSVKNLARSTPLFEGDLDGVVFGSGETADVRQWPAEKGETKLRLKAGTLHGLAQGERLAVLASPADSSEDAITYATVDSATTFGATATLEDGTTLEDIPRGAFLRKVEAGVDLTLRVALPEGDGTPQEAMRAAAEAITADGMLGGRFAFVEPGEEADIRLAVIPESPRPDAIWILDGTGMVPVADGPAGDDPALNFSALPSVSTGDKSGEELAGVMTEQFAHIGKALNVLRIGAASAGNGLNVPVELHRARFDLDAGAIVEGSRAPLDAGNVPRLIPGDTVGVRVENTTDGPLDINVLYVGADYSITFMDKGRMQPGGIYNEDLSLISDESFGRDRLVVILSPAGEQSDVEDLSFLEQDPLVRTRAVVGSAGGFKGLLDEAGFGQRTRAALPLSGKKKGPEPMILQFEIDTVPGEG